MDWAEILMSCKDVLDSVQREGSIQEGIGLKVVEGSRDGNLIGGYGVGACSGVDKLVSDDDQLMFEVAGELDWEWSRREGHGEAIMGSLVDEMVQIVVFAGGFCFPLMFSKGQHL